MKKELLEEIKKAFPSYKSRSFDYVVNYNDVSVLFGIVNRIVFNGKLDQTKIELCVIDSPNTASKGSFLLSKTEKMKSMIFIRRHPHKDNFGQIASVLCHEMIHAYDRYYGPLKDKVIDDYCDIADVFDVKKVGKRQLVNGYDAHGSFFHAMGENIQPIWRHRQDFLCRK